MVPNWGPLKPFNIKYKYSAPGNEKNTEKKNCIKKKDKFELVFDILVNWQQVKKTFEKKNTEKKY